MAAQTARKVAKGPAWAAKAIREHEILRVDAKIGGKNTQAAADNARLEVLKWAEHKVGRGNPKIKFPNTAWVGQEFEYHLGGRNCSAVRIDSLNDADIWALRVDDPDKNVPGRVWTAEVIIVRRQQGQPQLYARLLASTPEESLRIPAL